jgi:hypothetical protein
MENREHLKPQLAMGRLLYLSLYIQVIKEGPSSLGSHAQFQSYHYSGTISHEQRTLMSEQAKCSGKNFSMTGAFFPANASISVARIARIMN